MTEPARRDRDTRADRASKDNVPDATALQAGKSDTGTPVTIMRGSGPSDTPATDTDASDAGAPRQFLPLGNYVWPALPTDETLKRWWKRLLDVASRDKDPDEPFVADAELDRLRDDVLDRVAGPPSCGPLLGDLAATLRDWIDNPNAGDTLRLIVLPPCDDTDILSVWARAEGLHVEAPPERGTLPTVALLADHDGDGGVIVIPALEKWFLRTADGLSDLRVLLSELSRTRQRCVIGCNSWAWTYLRKAVDAQAFLPKGLTFQSFGAEELQRWFRTLSTTPGNSDARFRVSTSGTDLFDNGNDTSREYFVRLASVSLGIPWVAWWMWRNGMRDMPEVDPADMPDDARREERKTYWLTDADVFTVPVGAGDAVLLTLQSLLIHGALTEDDLARTLPHSAPAHTVAALLKAKILMRSDDRLKCNPAAYPSIRDALSDAGFNTDEL